MENNVQDWLNKINLEEDSEYTLYDINPILMERYANYKSKEYQKSILTFRSKLQYIDCTPGNSVCICLPNDDYCIDLQTFFDEHFNIQHGK